MIGAALNEVDPPAARTKPFVIGAAQPRFSSRPAVAPRGDDGFVIGAATGGRTGSASRAIKRPEPRQISRPAGRRDYVVVGLRHDKK